MEDDGIPEDDGMVDSGYLESQANNMDPLVVRLTQVNSNKRNLLSICFHNYS